MQYDQLNQTLVTVLNELARSGAGQYGRRAGVANHPFDGPRYHHLVELVVPASRRRRERTRHLVAVTLHHDGPPQFVVYQPHWLVPLQEELAAISDQLGGIQPTIQENFVVAWLELSTSQVHTRELVREAQEDLNRARQEYWALKAKLLRDE